MTDDEAGGFRPIGNSMPSLRRSPEISGSTPDARATPSATTGSRLPAATRSSSTGAPLSERGAAGLPTPLHERVERALRMFGLPREAERWLPSLALALDWQPSGVIAADGQFDRLVPGAITIRANADVELGRRLLRALDRVCDPCREATATAAFAELRALTVARSRSDEDLEMMAAGYISRLAEFPGDVVHEAVRRWVEREQWFPSWAELRAEIDKLVSGRQRLRRALLHLVEHGPPRQAAA
jgi:hypothetical protein